MKLGSLLRQTLVFDRGRMDVWVALRNSVGIGLALFAGVESHDTSAGLVMAIGAINVSLSDAPDGYALRARRMLGATFVSAFAVALGFALPKGTALDAWLVAAVAVAWGFVAGLATALGTVTADLFTVGLVTFIIFGSRTLPPMQALTLGGFALAGGLVQTSLAVVFWPIRGFGPERRSLGLLYLDLARLATRTSSSGRAPLGSDEMNRARLALAELPRDAGLVADRYRSLLSQAERIRVCLIALSRLRRRGGEAVDPLDRALAASGRVLVHVGESLVSRDECTAVVTEDLAQLEKSADRLRELARRTESGGELAAAALRVALLQLASLAGQLRAAVELSERTTPRGFARFQRRERGRPYRLRFTSSISILRANLDRDSVAFRHAVRIAIGIAIGEALTHLLKIERSYWMPMTILLVLRPEYGATLSRALMRVGGTLAGTGLATGLFLVLPRTAPWEVGTGAVFFFLLRWIGWANYGIFAFLLTALVTLLMSLTGVDPQAVIVARGLNTFIGGLIAVSISVAWPTLERKRVRDTVARMILAYRDYLTAVAGRYRTEAASTSESSVFGGARGTNASDNADEGRLDAARSAGRVARSNVEASFERLEVETGLTLETRGLLRAIQASSNRFAHAIMSLDAAGEGGLPGHSPLSPEVRRAFDAFAREVEEVLCVCAKLARGETVARRVSPDLRESYANFFAAAQAELANLPQLALEADRMTNSLNTLRAQIAQWAESEAGATGAASPVRR